MIYSPHTVDDRKKMLDVTGCSIDELFSDIPSGALLNRPLDLPEPMDEQRVLEHIKSLSGNNIPLKSFAGAGIYERWIPPHVEYLASLGNFSTAYTPYQPEASQGTLKAIFEFQSFLSGIFCMDITNASLYDGATAAAEALRLANSMTGSKKFAAAQNIHPCIREVIYTWNRELDFEIIDIPFLSSTGCVDIPSLEKILGEHDIAGVLTSHPNFFGTVEEMDDLKQVISKHNSLWIVYAEPLSQMLLEPPGAFSADVVVAEGQPLGLNPGYGGTGIGIFSCKKEYIRRMPGRLVGETVDTNNNTGYTLTLQTREQHIRREKATSNICSNQSLSALYVTLYISALGPEGLKQAAENSLTGTRRLADGLCSIPGIKKIFDAPFINDILLFIPVSPERFISGMLDKGFCAGVPVKKYYPDFENAILLSATETKTNQDIDEFVKAAKEVLE